MPGHATIDDYYREPAVRARIVEYCGGSVDRHPTALYLASMRAAEAGQPSWEQAPRHGVSDLDELLATGADIAPSLWDRTHVLVVCTTLQGMHDAGVRAVELGTPPRHFDPWRHDQVLELSHRLREFRIAPIAIHAPFGGLLDLTDPNPHHRHAAIGAILSAASALRELGGTKVVVHVSDVQRHGADLDERIAHATCSLRVLSRACAHMDALLLVETPLPHLVGGHPDEFAAVVKPLDRAVGVCFDTSHATLGHHWDAFMNVAGHRLVHVHANDHHGQRDDHLPPGDGITDWAHIRDTLSAVGFDGWIVLELSCPGGPLSEFMSGALRRARVLFGATDQA